MSVEFFETTIGTFKRRAKRFFVFVEDSPEFINQDGESVAYCSNTGKMSDILIPGSKCLFSRYNGKLKWKWEAVCIDNIWIGTNVHNPNVIAKDILKNLWPDETFKAEVTFGRYRADFASKTKVIEVKHVHWAINKIAYFPDCIAARGARQMLDLIFLQSQGYKCFVIYILQRNDVEMLGVADWIDKQYAINVNLAKEAGVKFLAFNCNIHKNFISYNQQIIMID